MEISMSVKLGNIVAVTGPSGAGKTTLLRQIAGLVHPQTGHIQFNNSIWLDTNSKTSIPTQKEILVLFSRITPYFLI